MSATTRRPRPVRTLRPHLRRWKRELSRAPGRLWRARGDRVECPFCGWTGGEFDPAGRRRTHNRSCPRCGARERHRMLHLLLEEKTELFGGHLSLLDIAPRPFTRALAARLPEVRYVGMDLSASCAPDVRSDLTRIGIRSAVFDLVLCSHVLEHVADDRAAMGELHRLVRPGGLLLVQVPLGPQPTMEDPAAPPETRILRFGLADHVRLYGPDILDRLADAGFEAEFDRPVDWCSPATAERYAIDDSPIIVARA